MGRTRRAMVVLCGKVAALTKIFTWQNVRKHLDWSVRPGSAQCLPTVLDLPSGLRVAVPTRRWTPYWWDGEIEPVGLPQTWARKPMVAVDGHPHCAELAILGELALAGWQGVWVSAFGIFLRREWFPGACVPDDFRRRCGSVGCADLRRGEGG